MTAPALVRRPRSGHRRLGKADMHLHTLYSDGCATVQELLDHVEHNTDLDVIAITDHERIDGALRPLDETLERIHDQGGIAIAAHPLAPLTPSLGRRSLLRLHTDPDERHSLDAIELVNPSAAGRSRRV